MIDKLCNDAIVQRERNEARKQIEEKIKKSKTKKRIHIDKDELEFLLFDTVNYKNKDGKNKTVKFLVWSGSFLSKIDLSNVDFSNVAWDINFKKNDQQYYLEHGITEINLSNTNAKIDFAKGPMDDVCDVISGCNFEGTDLSKSFSNIIDFNKMVSEDDCRKMHIYNCNFKNTKLKLDINKIIKYSYSNNFSNNDFSKVNISIDFIINNPNNNFSYTEINIYNRSEYYKENIYDEIYRKDNFKGCYYNNDFITMNRDIDEINVALYLGSRGNIDKQIESYRKEVEKKLGKYKAKKRIHIDKDVLERLLFKKKELYYRGNPLTVKFLVWSGPFLSKIDLSEIDFSNVEWNLHYDQSEYEEKIIEDTNCEELEKYKDTVRIHEINVYDLNNIREIDLSHTNAKIDFSKSNSYITSGLTVIQNCNFEGTDLSNNELGKSYIGDSNLSNTGIKVSDEIWSKLSDDGYNRFLYFYIQRSNVSGNDFSSPYQIGMDGFYEHLYKSNLENTGINILVKANETLEEVVEDNSINGCLINRETKESYERKLKLKELRKEKRKFEKELHGICHQQINLMEKINLLEQQIKNLK